MDVGTGSIRAIVFNSDGEVVAKRSVKSNLYQEHFNWAVQKPEEILDNTVNVCRSVINEIKREKRVTLLDGQYLRIITRSSWSIKIIDLLQKSLPGQTSGLAGRQKRLKKDITVLLSTRRRAVLCTRCILYPSLYGLWRIILN